MLSKDKLIQALKENEYVKEYKRLEKLLNKNKKLKEEIIVLQTLQQEMINLKTIEKHKALKIVEDKYWKRRNKLEENPLIRNYLNLQEEINNLLKLIKEILEAALII